MQKKLIFFAFLLGIFSSSFAQVGNFKMSDYKLPDIERHEWTNSFSANGLNNLSKNGNNSSEKSNAFNIYFNSEYNYFLNTRRFQREINTGFALDEDFQSTKEGKKLLTKYNEFATTLFFNLDNRVYFKEKTFFEVDAHFNFDIAFRKIKDIALITTIPLVESDVKENNRLYNIDLRVPLKLGVGRLERVEETGLTACILTELSKLGTITDNASSEDIIKLTEFISQLRSKRYFDSRIKKMEELEALDSFLVANNYLSKGDIKYFTSLMDSWDYGLSYPRYSGSRFAGFLTPGVQHLDVASDFSLDYFQFSTEMKERAQAFFMDAGVEYDYGKPINLLWQNTIHAEASFGYITGRIGNRLTKPVAYEKTAQPNIKLGFKQSFDYYPNTRTGFFLSYGANFAYMFDAGSPLDIEGSFLNTFAGVSCIYYISPQLRLNFSYDLVADYMNANCTFTNGFYGVYPDMLAYYYRTDRRNDSGNLQSLFNITLTYSIF